MRAFRPDVAAQRLIEALDRAQRGIFLRSAAERLRQRRRDVVRASALESDRPLARAGSLQEHVLRDPQVRLAGAERLAAAGVDVTRIQASGLGGGDSLDTQMTGIADQLQQMKAINDALTQQTIAAMTQPAGASTEPQSRPLADMQGNDARRHSFKANVSEPSGAHLLR